MLRIVILPAAVSPANIISQKPRGFYITFRKENITPGKARNITFVHRTVTAMQAGNMRRQGLQVCHCEGASRPWQSRSTRLDSGAAIGENATAFPRLPRPRWGLAMTIRGTVSVLTLPCSARQCSAGPGCPFPYSARRCPVQRPDFCTFSFKIFPPLSPDLAHCAAHPSSGGRTPEFVQIREKKEKFYANFC